MDSKKLQQDLLEQSGDGSDGGDGDHEEFLSKHGDLRWDLSFDRVELEIQKSFP